MCIVITASVNAQYATSDFIIDGFIEAEETSPEEVLNLIEQYSEKPIVWNECSELDITELPLNLTLRDILIALKRENKEYYNWDSFQKDLGITDRELNAIKLFVTLESPKTGSGSVNNYTSIKKDKYDSTDISKNNLKVRWASPSDWFFGVTAELDQGEPHIWDFYNVSFQTPEMREKLSLIGGSYRMHWGYGLLFTTNLMGTRSSDAVRNVSPKRNRMSNYLGSDENKYLFGLGVNLKANRLTLSPFISVHNYDATIDDGLVKTIRTDGIHSSISQLEAKDALSEKLYGLSALYNLNKANIGVLYFRSNYSYPLEFMNNLANLYGFSLYHSTIYKNINLTGEIAYLSSDEWAIIQTGLIETGNISFCISGRYFSSNFCPIMGYPSKHYSGYPKNEKGIYLGVKIKLRNRWWLSGYADYFSRVQPTEIGEPTPKGDELVADISRNSKRFNVNLKLKRLLEWDESSSQQSKSRINMSGSFSYYILSNYRITARLSNIWSREYESSLNKGMAFSIYSDLESGNGNVITTGVTNFFADSFESRNYLFEPGVPLRFNIVSVHGTGYRAFVVFRRNFDEMFDITLAGKFQKSKEAGEKEWSTTSYIELQMLVDL